MDSCLRSGWHEGLQQVSDDEFKEFCRHSVIDSPLMLWDFTKYASWACTDRRCTERRMRDIGYVFIDAIPSSPDIADRVPQALFSRIAHRFYDNLIIVERLDKDYLAGWLDENLQTAPPPINASFVSSPVYDDSSSGKPGCCSIS